MNVEDLAHPAEEVAPELLGAVLTHETPEGTVSFAITETEAYAGPADPGSHAYRGTTPPQRRDVRARGTPVRLLLLRCALVRQHRLRGGRHRPAVLLRAGRVIEGADLARERPRGARSRAARLARGPGNFCQALGITASTTAQTC